WVPRELFDAGGRRLPELVCAAFVSVPGDEADFCGGWTGGGAFLELERFEAELPGGDGEPGRLYLGISRLFRIARPLGPVPAQPAGGPYHQDDRLAGAI